MMEKVTPTEDDVVLDTTGYSVICVICGTKMIGVAPLTRRFSCGDNEDTAYCTGVMFLCEKHRDDDNAIWCLLERMKILQL